MIQLRIPKASYSLRANTDGHLLEPKNPRDLNLKKTEAAFSIIAPKIWNELPLFIRSQNELSLFKKDLKTYLFDQAYEQ